MVTPSRWVFKECYHEKDGPAVSTSRPSDSCLSIKRAVTTLQLEQTLNYQLTDSLTQPTLNYACKVCASLTHKHRTSKPTQTCSAFLISMLQMTMMMLKGFLKGLSRPMSGRSCSSAPSWQPFPDPSLLSAPPPVTSSSSCYPVRSNNLVMHVVNRFITRYHYTYISM